MCLRLQYYIFLSVQTISAFIDINAEVNKDRSKQRQNTKFQQDFTINVGQWQEPTKPPLKVPVGSWSQGQQKENPIGPSGHQRPHEFRDVPKGFSDWYGLAFDVAYQTFGYGFTVQIAAQEQIVEQQFDGEPTAAENWIKQDDDNEAAKLREHQTELKSQDKRLERKNHQAWEKKKTEIHGFWSCRAVYCQEEATGGPGGGGGGGGGGHSRGSSGYSGCHRFKEVESGKWVENCAKDDFFKFTETNTKVTQYGQTHFCQCNWVFDNTPNQRHSWASMAAGSHFTQDSLRFPINVGNWRFRTGKSGQNMCDQEWQIQGWVRIQGEQHRQVYLRSPFQIDAIPVCLVDHIPRYVGNTRGIFAMKCTMSFQMFDGREIWHMPWTPKLMRWYSEEYMDDIGGQTPLITGNQSNKNDVIFKGMNSIQFVKTRQCLQVFKDLQQQYFCGQNVKDDAFSSRRVVVMNTPCAAGTKEMPQPFWFDFDDDKPRAVYAVEHPYAYLKNVAITFNGFVNEFSISCFDDYTQEWFIVDSIKDVEEYAFELNVQQCTKMAVEILKQETECETQTGQLKKCSGIKNILFGVDQYQVKQAECLPDDGELEQRWFFEPAEFSSVLTGQQGNLQEFLDQRSIFNAHVRKFKRKYKELAKLNTSFDPTFGVDPASDKFVQYIQCEKGCDNQGRGDRLETIYKDLLTVKARFGIAPGSGNAKLSEGKNKAAPTCAFVKSILKREPNGFQWVQSKCSKDPAKVYCMLDRDLPKGQTITSNHEQILANLKIAHLMKKPENFLKICEKKGMRLAKVETLDDLKNLALLTILHHYTINSKQSLLLGVDNACYGVGCSGKFYSLDGTTELNGIAKAFNEWLGKSFEAVKGNEVLVLNNGMLTTVPQSESHISALPCETKNEEKLFLANCDMKIGDFVELFDAQKFVCPATCNSGHVYGNNMQHSDSNICMAATHSGMTEDVGDGWFVAHFKVHKKMVKTFEGGAQNDIESESMNTQSKGYTFYKVEEKCPDEINAGISDAASKFFLQRVANVYQNLTGNGSDIDIDDNTPLKKPIDVYDPAQAQNAQDIYENPTAPERRNFRQIKGSKIDKFNSRHNGETQRKFYKPHSGADTHQAEESLKQINNFPHHQAAQISDNSKSVMDLKQPYRNLKSFRKENKGIFAGNGVRSNMNQVTPTRADNTAHIMGYVQKKQSYTQDQIVKEFRFKETDQNPNSQIDDELFNKMHSYKDIDFMNNSLIKLNNIQDQLNQALDMRYYEKHKNKIDKLRNKVFRMSTANPDILDHWNRVSGVLNQPRPTPGQIQTEAYKRQMEDEDRFAEAKPEDKKKKEEEEKSLDPELKKYKKFVDQDYKTVKDFRSDFDMHKDTYYDPNGKKTQDYPHYKYFKKDGDGTTITQIKEAVNSNNPIKIAQQQMKKWTEKHDDLRAKLDVDLKNLGEHVELTSPTINLLTEYEVAAEMIMKLANWELNFLKRLLELFDDAAESMFQYVSIAYVMDMPNNTEESLPGYFKILNLPTSKDIPEDTEFKVVEPSKILLKSDPMASDDSGYGVLLTTKYHKTQDGSLHLSVKMPEPKNGDNIFGIFFRYSDQFVNYALKINYKTKEVSLIRNSPWAYLLVHKEKVNYIANETYLRIVIQFKGNNIKWWIHPEEGTKETILDEAEKTAEFKQESDKFKPFRTSDAGMKEGRLGFFCSNCKGMVLKNITFYADKCMVEDKSGGPFGYLRSPFSARYKENFKKNVNINYSTWNCTDCIPKSEWMFKEVTGKLRGLTHTGKIFNSAEKKAPATLAQISDKRRWHQNMFKIKVSIQVTDGKAGASFVAFKCKNAQDYMAVGISFSKAKGTKKVTVFSMKGGKQEEIMEADIKGAFNPKRWNEYIITVVDNTLTVVMNRKEIIVDMLQNDLFADPEGGSVGFGSNNIISEFADIKMTVVLPDAFQLQLETLRRAGKAKQEKFISDESVEEELAQEAAASGEVEPEEPITEEDLVQYLECLQPTSLADRKKACGTVLALDETDECGSTWCAKCCAPKGSQKPKCVEECDALFVLEEPDDDVFGACLNPPMDFAPSEKSNDCQQCCKDLKGKAPDHVQDKAIAMCKEKFDKCTDPVKCVTTFSVEAEEEE